MSRLDNERVTSKLAPESTALVIIDMIEEFVAEDGVKEVTAAREMVPELNRVIDESREAGVTIIFLQHRNRVGGDDAGMLKKTTPGVKSGEVHSPGEQTNIYSRMSIDKDDIIVKKHQYSGFFETELDTILKTRNISSVAITGVATHICCDSTLRSAFFNGYETVMLEECNATYDIPDQGWGDFSAEEVNEFVYTLVSTNFGDVIDIDTYLTEIST